MAAACDPLVCRFLRSQHHHGKSFNAPIGKSPCCPVRILKAIAATATSRALCDNPLVKNLPLLNNRRRTSPQYSHLVFFLPDLEQIFSSCYENNLKAFDSWRFPGE